MKPRLALPADLDPLARLWHDGWREAHLAHVPHELTAKRTLRSFRNRLAAFGEDLRTAGPAGAPLGFCAIREDELDQLFVAPEARGTGLAATLLADAEARLYAKGVRRPHLLCVIQNARAARFYESQGWENMGIAREAVQTEEGPFFFDVLRFEKSLEQFD